MSNKIPVLTELPVISSLIKVESELLSKKSSELSKTSISEYNSNESIKIGNGIPNQTLSLSNSANISNLSNISNLYTTLIAPEYEINHLMYITLIILFFIIAGLSYYFFYNYRQKKSI